MAGAATKWSRIKGRFGGASREVGSIVDVESGAALLQKLPRLTGARGLTARKKRRTGSGASTARRTGMSTTRRSRRGSLTMWLDESMQWFATPTGKRGCSPTFSETAIQSCLSIKCLFGQPLRQALGMVQSRLRLAKLDWPAPATAARLSRPASCRGRHLQRSGRARKPSARLAV